jgi:hypothetical protein
VEGSRGRERREMRRASSGAGHGCNAPRKTMNGGREEIRLGGLWGLRTCGVRSKRKARSVLGGRVRPSAQRQLDPDDEKSRSSGGSAVFSLKKATFTKGMQLAPHATSGALWYQKIPRKWSPCSPRVARGSKVGMGRREKTGLCQFFPFSSRFVFSK